jgi:hypothetical protein
MLNTFQYLLNIICNVIIPVTPYLITIGSNEVAILLPFQYIKRLNFSDNSPKFISRPTFCLLPFKLLIICAPCFRDIVFLLRISQLLFRPLFLNILKNRAHNIFQVEVLL